MAAVEKRYDIFGAFVLATVTAVGGGTLRDIMIGNTPVSWMQDSNYLILIIVAIPFSVFFIQLLNRLRKTIFLFDTLGIGLFTIIGIDKAISAGLTYPFALLMGIISAVFGGVIRDILCNATPLIFRKEIYATACFLGGLVYLLLKEIELHANMDIIGSIFIVIIIRIASIRYRWRLPRVIPKLKTNN